MGSYNNFQTDTKKYKNGLFDIYKKPKNNNNINQQLSKGERLREGFKRWTSFYRANPHRFAEEYLGITLHLFQKILVYLSFHIDYLMYLAARGQGKSYLIAVICCIRCILYPQTKIIVASGTKGQAKLIITEKIAKDLVINYPNLAREIKEIKTSANEIVVIFQNGSTITAVTSTDSSRGYRGNILILDEFRLIKEENLKNVLRPFLTVIRQPPYLKKPEYAHLKESNKEIYISSAWYKSHWIWKKFIAFAKKMAKAKEKFNYFACGLPYQLSMHHGLLDEKRVQEIKSEEDMDEISWLMEMECMFFGESENAWFKLDSIQDCRSLIKPFYPQTTEQFLETKDKRKKSNKQDGEIRIIGVDVALMNSTKEENDNTIYTFVRLLPKGEEYDRQVSYIESISGAHPTTQAIKLKQMFYDLECDYVAMDTTGNGMSLYDECTKVLYDEERDVEYPAWCSMNDEKMESRAYDKNALPIIYSIKATTQINHEMAMLLKSAFEKKKIKLLINDIQGKEYLIEKHDYMKKGTVEKINMLKPYTQTTLLINEMVNLEYTAESGYVKVKEVGRNRKDRYSSLAYANYYAKILELKLKKKYKASAKDYALW
jgi:hypothetical protein